MSQIQKIRLKLPTEAYELLLEAAKKSNMDTEEFAKVCIYSVLANYAKHAPFDAPTTFSASDDSDSV